MDWTQVLAILLGNLAITIPLWLWARGEAREDTRHMQTQLDAIRELINSIHLEMKDFHGRLCAIEEKNRRRD